MSKFLVIENPSETNRDLTDYGTVRGCSAVQEDDAIFKSRADANLAAQILGIKYPWIVEVVNE
jgi:hypothetical protein